MMIDRRNWWLPDAVQRQRIRELSIDEIFPGFHFDELCKKDQYLVSRNGQIINVDPPAAIPGGELVINCAGFAAETARVDRCEFDGVTAQLVASSPRRVMAAVPEQSNSGSVEVILQYGDTIPSSATCIVGQRLAGDLHPVASPAFDPQDGALFVTRSGSRGQQLPVTLFRIDVDGEVTEFSGDIQNPTGIAFDQAGQMFVTNRADGIVCLVNHFREAIPRVTDLGTATGIAFDRDGLMYVGDRTGTIFRIDPDGGVNAWAEVEPSVSAFHLAFGPDDHLYVTGPTVSSHECVTRIDPLGQSSVFFRGLGRPQGLAFDREGHLYVAASWKGRRGVVRIDREGTSAEMAVAGMNVVGLAFSRTGDMAVATNDSVYSVPMGIYGTLLN
jgi:sugar lactone lactonase YvrE